MNSNIPHEKNTNMKEFINKMKLLIHVILVEKGRILYFELILQMIDILNQRTINIQLFIMLGIKK